MIKLKNLGFSLIEVLISLALSLLIFSVAINYLSWMIVTFNRLQFRINRQTTQLLAKHYLGFDLRNAFSNRILTCNFINQKCKYKLPDSVLDQISREEIKANSPILIIDNISDKILYYLRPSIIANANRQRSYTLYRDDLQHDAIALLEGLIDMQLLISAANSGKTIVYITLIFKDNSKMELVCAPRNIA